MTENTPNLERPQEVKDIFPYQDISLLEKARRYDGDVKTLKQYILELEELVRYHEKSLPKDAEAYKKALEDISTIVHDTLGFPVAIG